MKLYAYTLPAVPEKSGWLKIGQTTGSVQNRVKSQLSQANLQYEIVFQDAGIVGKREITDKEIHRELAEKGFEKDGNSEWFRCTADDVRDALNSLKERYRSEDKRKELEQKFYEELRNWYFWATEETKNPDCSLRIVIRLLLCFFLREKELVPKELFEENFIKDNLKEDEYRYYKVIIRNLFFYSLNTPQENRKELENKNLIKNYGVVKRQFHENIPFLNGGLFTEHSGDDIPLNDDYFFTAPRTRTIKELGGKYPVAGIVYILSQYKYTLDETENSDLIDPEFIGKMFESLLSCIDADTKESRRKVTGSYYTPREIVDYMVEEALKSVASEPDELLSLKILDPACGSGAFPCGVMNAIMKRLAPQKELPQEERYEKKLTILQNVIYGVDIQPMAVQIAMLRLFISLVQDVQPDRNKPNFGIKALPNLDYKFAAADTLKGIQIEGLFFHSHKVQFEEIIELKKDYFSETDYTKRERLRKRIYRMENDLAEKSDNEGIQALCRWNHSDTEASPCFDSRWLFGVEKFDIVIGNPPYVRQERLGQKQKDILKGYYPKIANGTADLYVYFYGAALNYLAKNGTLIFITGNKYLKTKYGLELRNFLSENYNVNMIIDFFELPVFQASTDAAITKITNSKTGIETQYFPVKTLENLDIAALTNGIPQRVIKDASEWKFVDNEAEMLLTKLYDNTIPLKEFADNRIYRGIITGFNEAFVLSSEVAKQLRKTESRSIVRRYAESTDIRQWKLKGKDRYFLATGYDLDIPQDYPSAYAYLLQFEEKLKQRQDQGKNWWNLRACAYYSEFDERKLIYIHTALDHQFYFDTEGRYINNSCYMIVSDNTFLFCFLNSKLFKWFKKIKFVAYGDATEKGRAKLDYNKMLTVPIKKITSRQEKKFTALVAEAQCGKCSSAGLKKIEDKINAAVYRLYGLTDEEIKLVEGK